MQIRRHFFDKVVAVADVDQRPRVRQLRVHQKLLHRLGIVDRAVAADALDLRCLRVYRVDGVPSRPPPRRRRDHARSLSAAPRRYHGSGPKRLKIGKETIHGLV